MMHKPNLLLINSNNKISQTVSNILSTAMIISLKDGDDTNKVQCSIDKRRFLKTNFLWNEIPYQHQASTLGRVTSFLVTSDRLVPAVNTSK